MSKGGELLLPGFRGGSQKKISALNVVESGLSAIVQARTGDLGLINDD